MEVCRGLGDAPELGAQTPVRLTWKVALQSPALFPPTRPGTRREVPGWQPLCLTQGPSRPPLGMAWSNAVRTHGVGRVGRAASDQEAAGPGPPRAGGRVGPCRGTRLCLGGPRAAWECHLNCGY